MQDGICSKCGEHVDPNDECCAGAKVYSEGGGYDEDTEKELERTST